MSSNTNDICSVHTIIIVLVSFVFGILTPLVQDEITRQFDSTNHRILLFGGDVGIGEDTDSRLSSLWDGSSSTSNTISNTISCSDNEQFQDYTSDIPIPGYHIVCFERSLTTTFNDDDDNSRSNIIINIRYFPNGQVPLHYQQQQQKESNNVVQVLTPNPTWNDIKNNLQHLLLLRSADSMHQPWSIFSTSGQYIINENGDQGKQNNNKNQNNNNNNNDILDVLVHHGIVLLYQGGQFLWPGIRIGYHRTVSLYSIMPNDSSAVSSYKKQQQQHRNVTIETLSVIPLVLSVQGFLSEEECDYIQTKASPYMIYSDVVLMDKDKGRDATDFRTSQTTFLEAGRDKILLDLDYRTASLVRIPRHHQEPIQVLRYAIGQRYSSHMDYFDPIYYQNDPSTLQLIANGRRNRMVTVFWYLSNVGSGGETIFPRYNGQQEISMEDCTSGLKVTPEKGKVIIFYSMKPNGDMDPTSLHGACPVQQGTKWAANKWIWNEPMQYVAP